MCSIAQQDMLERTTIDMCKHMHEAFNLLVANRIYKRKRGMDGKVETFKVRWWQSSFADSNA
jgi:hypothetical protein